MKTQLDYVDSLQHLKHSQELLVETPSPDKAITYNESIARAMEILDNREVWLIRYFDMNKPLT